MRFTTTVAGFASLLAFAAADQVLLLNCLEHGVTEYTVEAYYPTGATANYEPDSDDLCYPVGMTQAVDWNDPTSCTFPTQVTFKTNIDSGANNYAPFTPAGTASNNFHSYKCYRDDQHEVFFPAVLISCISEYYCLQN